MKTVIYPGTFDPITHGHTDIIKRAANLFDRVIVAVAPNTRKNPLFTLDERVALIQQATAEVEGVEVCGIHGLLVDFARQQGACAVIRGVRAVADYEYELQLANMNRSMAPEVETVFLTPADNLSYISSTLVREIASLNGDVSPFVCDPVMAALAHKFADRAS